MRHSKKPWRSRARGASTEATFEDALFGVEARSPNRFDPKNDRKTQQLCRQVQRALMLALAGECADKLLQDVQVESVEPIGGASQLLVRVIVSSADVSPMEVVARLNERAGKLCTLVAQAICRKRAPSLSFVAVPAAGAAEGGGHA